MDRNLEDNMPKSKERKITINSNIGFVLSVHSAWLIGERVYRGIGRDYILGFPIPEWQRGICWSDEQCIKFIESIWLEQPIGTFMINVSENIEKSMVDGLLIDGQQRLHAIERYINNEIAVKNKDGVEIFWKDASLVAKRRFKQTGFPYIEVRTEDEGVLIDTYNRLNFSGTPHNIKDFVLKDK